MVIGYRHRIFYSKILTQLVSVNEKKGSVVFLLEWGEVLF